MNCLKVGLPLELWTVCFFIANVIWFLMVSSHQMEIHGIRMSMQCNRDEGKAVCNWWCLVTTNKDSGFLKETVWSPDKEFGWEMEMSQPSASVTMIEPCVWSFRSPPSRVSQTGKHLPPFVYAFILEQSCWFPASMVLAGEGETPYRYGLIDFLLGFIL